MHLEILLLLPLLFRPHETIVVTGTYEPLSLDEIDRAVLVLPVRSQSLVFNSLADVIVLVVLARRHLLTLGSDLIFFCTVGSAIMAVSLVIQPRYFYFIYALLCLQAAQRRRRRVASAGASASHPAGLLKV